MRKFLTKKFWNIEIWAVQKHVNLVDLVKSFPASISLKILASIQKRTSPIKFAHLAEKSGKDSISNLSTKAGPPSPHLEGWTAPRVWPRAQMFSLPFQWTCARHLVDHKTSHKSSIFLRWVVFSVTRWFLLLRVDPSKKHRLLICFNLFSYRLFISIFQLFRGNALSFLEFIDISTQFFTAREQSEVDWPRVDALFSGDYTGYLIVLGCYS